ncbi:Neuropeptide-Like Protein [Caenorhabditis elegans]|uniref:Neuropeptide-Like Protein n=1 Tax=Caenorhabditis elegans TaxID=6239 RepID=Q8IFY6_CAEEL|nr:Neuropeptide-Like Protein [Caenorhabditis elegans]CCD62899.1 Neuropeptide-Like Protein [Caenorhabditis elegans]|eukprot:NP_872214.1 Uncharacterized protein CELE_C04E6.13 [Caenorhabditis elegans]
MLFTSSRTVVVVLLAIVVQVQGYWFSQRIQQLDNGMEQMPQQEMRAMKKTFLPPRYQNLWGQGESSKVVGSSALAPRNMDDYKIRTQQRHVFSWQPTNVFNEW